MVPLRERTPDVVITSDGTAFGTTVKTASGEELLVDRIEWSIDCVDMAARCVLHVPFVGGQFPAELVDVRLHNIYPRWRHWLFRLQCRLRAALGK